MTEWFLNSPVVQGLGFGTFAAVAWSSIPGWGTKSPFAELLGQKNFFNKIKCYLKILFFSMFFTERKFIENLWHAKPCARSMRCFFSMIREMALTFKGLTVWLRDRNNLWQNKAERNAKLETKCHGNTEEVTLARLGLRTFYEETRVWTHSWRMSEISVGEEVGVRSGFLIWGGAGAKNEQWTSAYNPHLLFSCSNPLLTGLQPVPAPPLTPPHTTTTALISTEHWAFVMKCSLLA